MKANIEISEYILGRYNSNKLHKLKSQLEELFNDYKERQGQSVPEEGIQVKISMSAKYQTPYVKVENWGDYKAVGDFEEVVENALEIRGFEKLDMSGDETSFKIEFE